MANLQGPPSPTLSLLFGSGRNNEEGHQIWGTTAWVGHFSDVLATLSDSDCLFKCHSRVLQELNHILNRISYLPMEWSFCQL